MKTTTQNKMQTSKATLVMMFVLLLSGVGMFGQNAAKANTVTVTNEITVAADDTTVATAASTEAANSSMNIVSWFMGSKQTPKATISNEGQVSSKKQLINAGIAPNRLLIKAFGKKAANYQSTIA
jgi:cytochrome b subunit of formate dehydrogenase